MIRARLTAPPHARALVGEVTRLRARLYLQAHPGAYMADVAAYIGHGNGPTHRILHQLARAGLARNESRGHRVIWFSTQDPGAIS
jgi:hypothetical protein